MKAKVKTKSNYKNVNDIELDVVEFLGSIIACKVPEYGFDKNKKPQGNFITADFNVKSELYWLSK